LRERGRGVREKERCLERLDLGDQAKAVLGISEIKKDNLSFLMTM
jgi:hypothetical protein